MLSYNLFLYFDSVSLSRKNWFLNVDWSFWKFGTDFNSFWFIFSTKKWKHMNIFCFKVQVLFFVTLFVVIRSVVVGMFLLGHLLGPKSYWSFLWSLSLNAFSVFYLFPHFFLYFSRSALAWFVSYFLFLYKSTVINTANHFTSSNDPFSKSLSLFYFLCLEIFLVL